MVQLLQRYNKTRSENRDVTIDRSFFCLCISCKCCCASFTELLKHVKAEQGKEATPCSGYKNDWEKSKKKGICSLDDDKSVMMEQGKRSKWNRVSGKRMGKKRVRKKHSWGQRFFLFLNKCDQRTEFCMKLFSQSLCQQNFCQLMSLP